MSDTSSAATCAQTFGADGTFAAALLILAGLCFLAAVVVHEVERMFFPALVPSQPAVELTLDGPQTVE